MGSESYYPQTSPWPMVMGIRIVKSWSTNSSITGNSFPERLYISFVVENGTPSKDFITNREIRQDLEERGIRGGEVGRLGYDVSPHAVEIFYPRDLALSKGAGIANIFFKIGINEVLSREKNIKSVRVGTGIPVTTSYYLRELDYKIGFHSYVHRIPLPKSQTAEQRRNEALERIRRRAGLQRSTWHT